MSVINLDWLNSFSLFIWNTIHIGHKNLFSFMLEIFHLKINWLLWYAFPEARTKHTPLLLTVTDLANSCVTPYLDPPQGSQGCLEKWNHPLSLSLVVWCAKIGPKFKKVKKTSELTKNVKKDDLFWRFFKLSWFWAQF